MARTTSSPVKEKRSYTLSPDSVRFLHDLRRKRKAASVSAVLEDIVQNARRASRARALDTAVEEYYSSLGAREVADDAAWGAFALSQFPAQES